MTATLLAPGVTLYAMGEAAAAKTAPASSKVRWGLLIDASKCKEGCSACIMPALKPSAGKAPAIPRRTRNGCARLPRKTREPARVLRPVMCQHCANPPCVDVCPTGASFKRADGIVLVDRHICIGCRYCMMACPYKARSFVHEPLEDQKPDAPRGKGTVEGCTLCAIRIDAGGIPHCVEACKAEGAGRSFSAT